MSDKKWIDYGALILSGISIVIAGLSASYQWQQSTRYSNNTHQVLINSAKLGMYDLYLMNYKVANVTDGTLDYGQLEIQLDSLHQNLATIKSIDPTTLPKDDAINYQVYREDLNTVITMINSYVDAMREDTSKKINNSEKLNSQEATRNNFRYGYSITNKILERDKTELVQHKDLYENGDKLAIKEMEDKK
ncbi:hypothetical protein G9406_05555 [Weissella paramesenteroides]|uniref:hypothetical protein n=1 Tax=Weissella paramesenteroides TaxID=1249 RepID=UPI002402652A|nr:hypothetical protein [Weissella paramesenteroides]MDF8367060.1 hypothetical protein [Weissella paramesenteroides]